MDLYECSKADFISKTLLGFLDLLSHATKFRSVQVKKRLRMGPKFRLMVTRYFILWLVYMTNLYILPSLKNFANQRYFEAQKFLYKQTQSQLEMRSHHGHDHKTEGSASKNCTGLGLNQTCYLGKTTEPGKFPAWMNRLRNKLIKNVLRSFSII